MNIGNAPKWLGVSRAIRTNSLVKIDKARWVLLERPVPLPSTAPTRHANRHAKFAWYRECVYRTEDWALYRTGDSDADH